MPRQTFGDLATFRLIVDSAQAAMMHAPKAVGAIVRFLIGQADPNDRFQAIGRALKVWYIAAEPPGAIVAAGPASGCAASRTRPAGSRCA